MKCKNTDNHIFSFLGIQEEKKEMENVSPIRRRLSSKKDHVQISKLQLIPRDPIKLLRDSFFHTIKQNM